MPADACALNENLGWALGSKTSDNEDASAPLGDSEVLSVEESPDAAAPGPSGHASARHVVLPDGPPVGVGSDASSWKSDVCAHEGAQDLQEVHAAVGGESSRHVLPDRPLDTEGVAEPDERPEEPGPLAVEPGASAGAAEVLAGGASDEDVGLPSEPVADRLRVGFGFVGEREEVGPLDRPGEVPREDPPPPRVELADADGSEAGSVEAEVESAGSGADREDARGVFGRLGACEAGERDGIGHGVLPVGHRVRAPR